MAKWRRVPIPFMLAESWNDTIDPSGWMMGEKLDGVRAMWFDGRLVSRNGNEFCAPGWFKEQLPDGVVLDGELYAGRGLLAKTAGTVRKLRPLDAEWAAVRYCVFDAPMLRGGFEERIGCCADILAGCAVASSVRHELCAGKNHLLDKFAGVLAGGGEGLVLRRPESFYYPGRSRSMLKVKRGR